MNATRFLVGVAGSSASWVFEGNGYPQWIGTSGSQFGPQLAGSGGCGLPVGWVVDSSLLEELATSVYPEVAGAPVLRDPERVTVAEGFVDRLFVGE